MKKCFNFNFNCFLKFLRCAIVVMVFVDVGLILYKLFLIIHAEKTPAAVFCMCTKWENLISFLAAAFWLVTLYVASRQLGKQSDMACISALAELRKQLTTGTNRNVHFFLSLGEDKKALDGSTMPVGDDKRLEGYEIKPFDKIPMIDVYNYLGTIGLGVHMVRKKLIEENIFYNHIGYRIENIFDGKSKAHEVVRKHIEDNRPYYSNLLWMYRRIQDRHANKPM